MLIRNLSLTDGLTNGTRLAVEDVINSRLLVPKVLTGKAKGKQVLIPRINLNCPNPEEVGFEFTRNTFPVLPAMCLTINKAQGMSLSCISLF